MKKIIGVFLLILVFASSALASNPVLRENGSGERVYCGDPAALAVDSDGDGENDTVYIYAGNDEGDGSYYSMPRYLCWSSKNMTDWKFEGVPISAADFPWGSPNDAWASQVAEYRGKYYFYNSKNATGISVAVSDSPTGPFVNALGSEKLIRPEWTQGKVSWDDIDPTIFIETGSDGKEHRYICWGNGNVYIAELGADMISLEGGKDGIREITINNLPASYTEAPWLYKRGEKYYLFFASNWREELSYAVADSVEGPFEYGGLVMAVGASSNTNHPAVIDFKGETYLIYHTGALANGGGYLRSVCIDRLHFDSEGGIFQLEESSVGLDGTASKITLNKEALTQFHFDNSLADNAYPMGTTLKLGENSLFPTDSLWEITAGLDSAEGHISIQAVNKMGYFITDYNGFPKLLHDDDDTEASRAARSFAAEAGPEGTALKSVLTGKYLGSDDRGNIIFSDSPSYFEIIELPQSSLSAKCENGKIIISGVSEPERELAVVINGGQAHVGFTSCDGFGAFSYEFAPEAAGRFEIQAAGRTVTVDFGGDN